MDRAVGIGRSGEMRLFWQALTRADRALIFGLGALAMLLFFGQMLQREEGAEVYVEVNGQVVERLPLDKRQRLEIEGEIGMSVIEVGESGAKVSDSPCPHKLCVKQGWIRHRGEVVVCVPNRLVLSIGRGRVAEVDAVVR